ncbi:phosphoribosylanthranilate isomerase [Salinirubrum litoreum]|uniref:N-(5'-phosphoribosyl)anthranilate isomerase n=1 Tax=Salinirubrum litoreum TaxID=1126234 RepID=A0ABD5R741_9EURY
MTRVKLCGVTSAADLSLVADAGADAVGVISEVPVDSHREVAPTTAAELVAAAPPMLTTTLVTMPEEPGNAVGLAGAIQPDLLQLHADFTPDELRGIRAETGTKLVVTVDADDPERAHELDGVVDAVLLDSTTEEGAGGTGETHDWAAAGDLAADLDTPVVLAGGLTPETVGEAVETARPYAVDVASGIEGDDGTKDAETVERFVRQVREADARLAETDSPEAQG